MSGQRWGCAGCVSSGIFYQGFGRLIEEEKFSVATEAQESLEGGVEGMGNSAKGTRDEEGYQRCEKK